MSNLTIFQTVNPNIAGIDIGSEKIFVSTYSGDVISYGTFTLASDPSLMDNVLNVNLPKFNYIYLYFPAFPTTTINLTYPLFPPTSDINYYPGGMLLQDYCMSTSPVFIMPTKPVQKTTQLIGTATKEEMVSNFINEIKNSSSAYLSLDISPNLFSNYADFRYNIPEEFGNANMIVFDGLGRKIKTLKLAIGNMTSYSMMQAYGQVCTIMFLLRRVTIR